jgi:hypothetical protein
MQSNSLKQEVETSRIQGISNNLIPLGSIIYDIDEYGSKPIRTNLMVSTKHGWMHIQGISNDKVILKTPQETGKDIPAIALDQDGKARFSVSNGSSFAQYYVERTSESTQITIDYKGKQYMFSSQGGAAGEISWKLYRPLRMLMLVDGVALEVVEKP